MDLRIDIFQIGVIFIMIFALGWAWIEALKLDPSRSVQERALEDITRASQRMGLLD